MRLAEVFADEAIVSAVRRQLSWTHLKTLIYIDDPVKRDFYIGLARVERWSTRQLQERIDSMLFERSAISRKPEDAIRRDLAMLREERRVSPDALLKDPYVLDFWVSTITTLKRIWRMPSCERWSSSFSNWVLGSRLWLVRNAW